MRHALLLPALLPLFCACGERPQRIGKEELASKAPSLPAAAVQTSRFAGQVVLKGDLAGVKSGAVFLSARRKGQRLPSLSHKYDITDPAWTAQEGNRVLSFTLTDQDNMGGVNAPMGAEMEVEARYDPDGFIDTRPGADEEGVVKIAVPASPGDIQLVITLQRIAGK
jgi:hypothetical protein